MDSDQRETFDYAMDEVKLKDIERLLCQSLNGMHLLFDHDHVAQILQYPTEDMDLFNNDNMDRLQSLFHRLIEKDSFQQKMLYIQNLDDESYEMLLRAYFHIVDSTAQISSSYVH